MRKKATTNLTSAEQKAVFKAVYLQEVDISQKIKRIQQVLKENSTKNRAGKNKFIYTYQQNASISSEIDGLITKMGLFFNRNKELLGLGLASVAEKSYRYQQSRSVLPIIQARQFDIVFSDSLRTKTELIKARAFSSLKGITDETGGKIKTILQHGFIQGENPKEIADLIKERANVLGFRSRLIARTEM